MGPADTNVGNMVKCMTRLMLKSFCVVGLTSTAFLVVLPVGGCSKGDGSATGSNVALIAATDSGYVAPDTLFAGLNHIAFENRGTTILECMLIRMGDDMSPQQYALRWPRERTFPPERSIAPPRSDVARRAIGNVADAGAGPNVLGCWINDHVAKLPPQPLVVMSAANPTVEPRADATIRLIDFRFEMEGEIEPCER